MNSKRHLSQLQRHVAGAIVSHKSPFSSLQVPHIHSREAFIATPPWIYGLMFGVRDEDTLDAELIGHVRTCNPNLVSDLLALFDWRPRTAGATIAALLRRVEYTDHIGKLLLRSDVCHAATGYCLALGTFATAKSIAYMCTYLDYYLTRKDLQFDQAKVYTTLRAVDRLLGTTHSVRYESSMREWIGETNLPLLSNIERQTDESMAMVSAFTHAA